MRRGIHNGGRRRAGAAALTRRYCLTGPVYLDSAKWVDGWLAGLQAPLNMQKRWNCRGSSPAACTHTLLRSFRSAGPPFPGEPLRRPPVFGLGFRTLNFLRTHHERVIRDLNKLKREPPRNLTARHGTERNPALCAGRQCLPPWGRFAAPINPKTYIRHIVTLKKWLGGGAAVEWGAMSEMSGAGVHTLSLIWRQRALQEQH